MVYTCCVMGCGTKDIHNIGFRSFPPIDTELFEQWKNATMNESLKKMDNMYIRKRKKVCNLHFPEKYRKRPCFLKYDYPKLTENIMKLKVIKRPVCSTAEAQKEMNINDDNNNSNNQLVYLDHTYCSIKSEVKRMNIVGGNIEITGNKPVDLDQSCSKTEVVAKDMNTNKITENKLDNLDQSYTKTVEVEAKATNILDNINRNTVEVNNNKIYTYDQSNRIIGSKIVNLGEPYNQIIKVNDENYKVVNKSINIVGNGNTGSKLVRFSQPCSKMVKVNNTEIIIVENNNASTSSKCVNFGEPYSKIEKVTNEKMNVDDNSNASSKLATFYQSYGKTIEEETVDKSVVDKMNSHTEGVVPAKKIIYLKNEPQKQSCKRMSRRQMQKRVYYLEKANRKLKADMRMFGNFKKLDHNVQHFLKCQMRNVGKKCRGETYSFQDKLFAFGIYIQSKACYKYLLNIFSLPSFTTVTKFYNQIKMDPEFSNVNIFNPLNQNIVEKLADYENDENTEHNEEGVHTKL